MTWVDCALRQLENYVPLRYQFYGASSIRGRSWRTRSYEWKHFPMHIAWYYTQSLWVWIRPSCVTRWRRTFWCSPKAHSLTSSAYPYFSSALAAYVSRYERWLKWTISLVKVCKEKENTMTYMYWVEQKAPWFPHRRMQTNRGGCTKRWKWSWSSRKPC